MPKDKLNDYKPILKGERLDKRMAELANLVSTEHGEVRAEFRSALEHARNAGEWLIEAKWRKGHRSKWGIWKRWLAKEYNIASRTMSLYMQVARHWDDPRIVEVRTQGITIESIGDFLRALKGEKPKPKPGDEGYTEPTQKEEVRDWDQKRIRKDFAVYLRTLDNYEMDILAATFAHVMEAFNTDLRMRVDGSYEGDYYKGRQEATGIHDPRIPPDLPTRPLRRRVRRAKEPVEG